MALIVLNVFPHPAHFEVTFTLADFLSKLGHEIHYASDQQGYRETVVSRGFPFYLIEHEKKFAHPFDAIFKIIQLFTKAKAIEEYLGLFKYLKSVRNAASHKSLFNKMIGELAPDLILIDHDLPFNAIHLTNFGIPCALIETRLPREMSDAVFPWETQSSFKRVTKTWKVKLLWAGCHMTRSIRRIVHWVQGLGTEQYYLAREIRYKRKDKRMEIDADGNFYFRADGIPKLILSHWDIAIPSSLKPYEIYIGPLQWEERYTPCDYIFLEKLKDLKQGKPLATKPLVFCLISPSIKDDIRLCQKFVQRLIDVFNNLPYQLVVAVGDDLDPTSFHRIGTNVQVLHTVPSSELLKCAELMITHGNIKRLAECIMNEVPSLIYPLPSNWDHIGNSTRAVYHGIGLRGSITNEKESEIQRKVVHLLSSNDYKLNTKKLKEQILSREKNVSLHKVISTLLSKKA